MEKEKIPSSGKEMMIIEYVVPESKKTMKDNGGLSEGLRHQHEEDLTTQIWSNLRIDNCSGLKLTENFKSIN